MKECISKTGLDVMADIAWGAHLCLFYHTKQDLLDVLIPYFRTGLANNECCILATSEHLDAEEARSELGKSITGLDGYIAKGQLEILDSRDWYTREGKFDQDDVLSRWLEKEASALGNGFSGLRAAGNMDCIDQKDWSKLIQYEVTVDFTLPRHRMICLCAYPFDHFQAFEPVELTANHAIVLFSHEGKWKTIQNSRSAKVCTLKENGLTYAKIGQILDVTRERARQIATGRKKSLLKKSSLLLTTAEAAMLLNVHVNTIRRWSNEGILRPYRVGTRGDRRFERRELNSLLRETTEAISS